MLRKAHLGAGLTVDEAQAGGVQKVFFQVVFPGGTVLPTQHLLPASHSTHEGQMVTATVVAQQCLHLGENVHGGVRRITRVQFRTMGGAQINSKRVLP